MLSPQPASNVVIVTYGGGTNSEALLIMMLAFGEPPPYAILMADTGDEKPHTYENTEMFSKWLVKRGYPPITMLRRSRRDKTWVSLEQDCRRRNVLPAVAYGWKTCSQKYKIEPQDKWMNNDPACRAAWEAGQLVTKIIGYDYGEIKRARFGQDEKYKLRYPLIEWKLTRAHCDYVIARAGLPPPGKSACFYCPHAKKHEILDLAARYPDLARRALDMEAAAMPKLKKIKGLGRTFAWRDVLQDPACPVIEDVHDEEPCACYDG